MNDFKINSKIKRRIFLVGLIGVCIFLLVYFFLFKSDIKCKSEYYPKKNEPVPITVVNVKKQK